MGLECNGLSLRAQTILHFYASISLLYISNEKVCREFLFLSFII